MADTTEQHEVNVPEVKSGSVQFLTPAAFANPAPARTELVCNVIRNCGLGLIPVVSAATIFTSRQSNIISFCLSVACIMCEGIKKSIGVKPSTT